MTSNNCDRDVLEGADEASDDGRLTVERAHSLLLIMVRGLMRGRDRDQRESIDVVQSIAGDLLRGQSGFLDLDADSQRRYLHVVAKHKLAALARKDYAAKRGGGIPVDHVSDQEIAASNTNFSSILARKEELAAMREGLELLEPETRSVLTLYASGASHEQIAHLFDATAPATRQRFVRAKRDLLIFALHREGRTWEEIACEIGITPAEAQGRFARLTDSVHG
ncbi:MAG: hypothetical protein U0640_11655 [Phycisphaerales bacterium]